MVKSELLSLWEDGQKIVSRLRVRFERESPRPFIPLDCPQISNADASGALIILSFLPFSALNPHDSSMVRYSLPLRDGFLVDVHRMPSSPDY
jgi:hypothetical protein